MTFEFLKMGIHHQTKIYPILPKITFLVDLGCISHCWYLILLSRPIYPIVTPQNYIFSNPFFSGPERFGFCGVQAELPNQGWDCAGQRNSRWGRGAGLTAGCRKSPSQSCGNSMGWFELVGFQFFNGSKEILGQSLGFSSIFFHKPSSTKVHLFSTLNRTPASPRSPSQPSLSRPSRRRRSPRRCRKPCRKPRKRWTWSPRTKVRLPFFWGRPLHGFGENWRFAGFFFFWVKAGWKWWTLKFSVWLDETCEIMDDFFLVSPLSHFSVHHVGNGVP